MESHESNIIVSRDGAPHLRYGNSQEPEESHRRHGSTPVNSRKRQGSPLTSDRQMFTYQVKDENWIPGYDPNSEPKPLTPMNHPAAIKAERKIVELNESIQMAISKHDYDGKDKYELLEVIKRWARPAFDRVEYIIAAVGAAGTGKSTSLNLLLNAELSRTSGSARSCTNTDIRFRYKVRSQSLSFKVTIYFRTQEAIVDRLTSHLASYYRDAQRWKRNDNESDAESDLNFGETNDSPVNGPSDAELGGMADTAVTVLTALFCAHSECRDREATAEFLNTAESADDPAILSKFRGWTADILKRLCSNGTSSVTFEAEHPDKLRKYVDPYTTTDYDDFPSDKGLTCHPWPIIANIIYNIDNATLRTGNEMRDAPGTLDSNKAHVDATTDSLRDADRIMVFADMTNRVASNESVENLIAWAYRRRGAGSIWLVLTKCDVNVERDDSIKFNAKEKHMLQKKEVDLQKQGMKLLRIKQELESSLCNTLEGRLELEAEASYLKSQMRSLSNKTYEIKVIARNRTTVGLMQDVFKKVTRDRFAVFRVFCLCSEEYSKHVSGYDMTDDEKAPRLSVEATGYPELRSFITGGPSDGRWDTLKHHINSCYDTLFSTLEMASSMTKSQRKDTIIKLCQIKQQEALSALDTLFNRFDNDKIDSARKGMEKQRLNWTKKAEEKCKDWSLPKGAHWGIVQTIVNNSGSHPSGDHDWNDDLLAIARENIEPMLKSLRDKCKSSLEAKGTEHLSNILEEFANMLQNDPRYEVSGAGAVFQASLQPRKTQIARDCAELGSAIDKAMMIIQDKATSAGPTGWFTLAMKPIWEKAAAIKKKKKSMNMKKARLKYLGDKVKAKTGPYYILQGHIIAELQSALITHKDALRKQLEAIFAEIERDINWACNKKGDDTKEGKQFQIMLNELVKVKKKERDEGAAADLLIAEEACKDLA